ncbi:MAG: hypothetical protein ACON5H_04275 [Akkermansiaceae bacterium]
MIRLIDERIMEILRDSPENVDFDQLVNLVEEFREETKEKPKCPHCMNEIQKQATKCANCLSELEWFKFGELYGPCKIGDSNRVKQRISRANEIVLSNQVKKDAQRRLDDAETAALKEALLSLTCEKCGKNRHREISLKFLRLEGLRRRQNSKVCEACYEKMGRIMCLGGIVICVVFLIWGAFFIS